MGAPSAEQAKPPAPPIAPVVETAGAAGADVECTIDAFHYGHFYLVQPKKGGHRAGMDAMLLAATIPGDATGHVADLGAGAGAAGLAVAARVPKVAVTLVERSPAMLHYARRTLALEQNAWATGRVDIVGADVTVAGNARRAAGLQDEAYRWVILNPPYNEPDDRRTPNALKAEAHAMTGPTLFDSWLRTAGAILQPGGQVSLIARPSSLGAILDALAGRFGATEVTPVHPRVDDEAMRILVTAIKQSRARLTLCPPLVLHDGPGHAFAPYVDALNNGRAALPRRRPAPPCRSQRPTERSTERPSRKP
ncbi:methyltransferase [Pseudohoeflea sp. DP4N28-3]|uniref:Methyltransferase n=2 Tax=Pseudohoeflea coraliihabitans TaxID=2860393 RepID=A0ABS6WLX9_9HYPH|nr:methyltransferase [Pseudohoeflea sp. DP4N28-3]MBW3096971.1 methyltransferase [Pseudohoeflea sp. DP4N28-3]